MQHIPVFLCLVLAVTARADIPARPSPQRLVNDFAGIFDSYQTAKLEEMLVAFDDSTSNQIAVVTVSDLEGYDPAEYATKIGIAWGVGSARFNNGIVVLVKPKNDTGSGRVSIQTGYGLEGAIPDIYAKHIIDNQMIPKFQEGDYFTGVYDGCRELMALASGEISEPRGYDDGEAEAIVLMVILLIIVVLYFVFRKKNGGNDFSGGGTGGSRRIYMGPLGGWGSGGGSSGGGFGGFGGGSFGGGGASGKW